MKTCSSASRFSLGWHTRIAGEQTLHLGSEEQRTPHLRRRKAGARPFGRARASALADRVPDGEGELADQLLDAFRAQLFIQVNITSLSESGAERVAASYQFGTELNVVEHLAVTDDPERAIFVADGLQAAFQVDDAEAVVPQAHRSPGKRLLLQAHDAEWHRASSSAIQAELAPRYCDCKYPLFHTLVCAFTWLGDA